MFPTIDGYDMHKAGDMAQEAREKDDFRTESWAMTSGTLQACMVDIVIRGGILYCDINSDSR